MVQRDVLIDVKGLRTHFFTDDGVVKAVDGVDFAIERGKTLCVVGESGCGKSITARSILQLIDKPGRIVAGEVLYHPGGGESLDLAALDPRSKEIRRIRGKEIAMIFQEPMSSLSPLHTIGNQLMEAVLLHINVTAQEAKERVIESLRRVGIPQPENRLDVYPFQLSGGMRQRVMIAMALVCEPRLLIADEPTTALDVTTQAQILDLVKGLQKDLGMAVMFITHDLGVVAEIADDVLVMYLGAVAERGDVDSIFYEAKHPYTQALLRSIPRMGMGDARKSRLHTVRGMVPHPFDRPAGCPFHPRCDQAMAGICDGTEPPREILGEGREVRCLLYSDLGALGIGAQATQGVVAGLAEPEGSAGGRGELKE